MVKSLALSTLIFSIWLYLASAQVLNWGALSTSNEQVGTSIPPDPYTTRYEIYSWVFSNYREPYMEERKVTESIARFIGQFAVDVSVLVVDSVVKSTRKN